MIYVRFNGLRYFVYVFLGFVEMVVKTFFIFRKRSNRGLEGGKNGQMDIRKPKVGI